MKTSPVPSSGFFRGHGVLLTAAGFLIGAAAGTFIYTVEKPVYESTAQFRPLRPATDVSGILHAEWLQNEVTALGSEQCLLRVIKNLNLENEYHLPAGEVVAALQKQLHVSVLPGSTVLSVTMQGQKAADCATLANAVTTARDEMTNAAIQESYIRERQRCEVGVMQLTASVEKRHLDLLDVTQKLGVAKDAVAATNLTAAVETAREAWGAEKARLAEMRGRLAATDFPPFPAPYAEILQYGKPPVDPVGPVWYPRTARWSVVGTVIGLTLALCLAAFRRRMNQGHTSPPVFPPRPVAAGEY